MLFSSPTFLYLFLPLVLIGSYLSPSVRLRNVFLVLMSFIFYAWGELSYVPLILVVVLVTHLGSSYQIGRGRRKRAVLALSVTVLITLLAFFKYYGFVLGNLQALGWHILPQIRVDLPLGISFFTFQAISQLVDVHRNRDLPKFQNLSLCRPRFTSCFSRN